MENEEELTEATESNIRFIVPDSQLDDDQSPKRSWDLIAGLPALKSKPIISSEKSVIDTKHSHISLDTKMTEKQPQAYLNYSSTNESEVEEQAVQLAADSVSDVSDGQIGSDKNVTVIEKDTSIIDVHYAPSSTHYTKHGEDESLISTPAQKIGSLQFSGEPIIVPETIDSFDEIAPSPDAYGSLPTVIPDSPCIDDKDENEESEEEITFRAVHPTVDPDVQKTAQTSTGLSESRAESQSFHLKLSPSQLDAEDADDVEVVTEKTDSRNVAAGRSPLKLGQDSHPVYEIAKPKLSFQLQKPTLTAEEQESFDGSEESISVFRRVKADNAPEKRKVLLEDSEDFPPVYERSSLTTKTGLTSPRKQPDKASTSKSAFSSKKSQGKQFGMIFDPDNSAQRKLGSEPSTSSKEKVDKLLSKTAHEEVEVQKGPSTEQRVDVDLTLSYDYTAGENLPDVSCEQPIEISQTEQVGKKQARSSDELIDLSQKHNTRTLSDKGCIPQPEEEFEGVCESSGQKAADGKGDTATSVLEQSPAQSVLSERVAEEDVHSCSKIVQPSTPKISISRVKHEKRSYASPEPVDLKSSIHHPEKGDKGDDHSSEANVNRDLHTGTLRSQKVGVGETSDVIDRTSNTSVTVQNLQASSLKDITYSDVMSLKEPKSLDPYVFRGSQSQTCEGVSHLLSSDKSHMNVTATRRRAIKIMRKVLRKRIQPRLAEYKSSSTDETSKPVQKRNLPKVRGQNLRKRQQMKSNRAEEQKPSKKQQQNQQQQTDPELYVTEHPVFTSLQKKAPFNKPFDPAPTGVGTSSPRASADPSGYETQQLSKEGLKKTGDSIKQSKKSATVSFSGVSNTEPADTVRESEGSEYEMERTTTQKIMSVVVTITEKIKTEVFSAKGEMVRRAESSKVVETTSFEPAVTSEEIKERIITHQLSPSRSTSTMTTGDLADISSSSLSRTNSSGSKGSNPSLEGGPHSLDLPTPAQRQHSSESQNRVQHVGEGQQDSDLLGASKVTEMLPKVDQKRLSLSSNTGQDLFSSPNQSIIDRADSQIGKVISSSNSTPNSHSMISPNIVAYNPKKDDNAKAEPLHKNGGKQTSSLKNHVASPELTAGFIAKSGENCEQVVNVESHGSKSDSHDNTKGRLGVSKIREVKHDKLSTENDSRKRKYADRKSSKLKSVKWKKLVPRKTLVEKFVDDTEESADVQSTGFSVHGVLPSASGESVKDPVVNVSSSKSSTGVSVSPQISFQGGAGKNQAQMVILKDYKSKVVAGAKVMSKWKDGYYYPGILSKVDQSSKKYMVKFDDGSQRVVKVGEIILAAELPVGQSVMVLTRDDFYEPGMIMCHSESRDEEGNLRLVYHVERDDGVTQMCERQSLVLSEGQAACLLSDEEMRISPDAHTPLTSNPADISLENLVDGKRHPKPTKISLSNEDQPSVSGLQPTSAATAAVPVSTAENESSHSGRKRKMGPVATSTPTPKQTCREPRDKGTPAQNKPTASVLGSAVASPPPSSRTPRKARVGLFVEYVTAKKSKLFEGMVFMLTHIEKSAENRAQEKLLLEGSSLETSTDENTELETVTSAFVKEQLQAVIEKGGGQVISSFDEAMAQAAKHCYLVAAEHQRTVKYLQALAARVTIVSHHWILDSVAHNKLMGLKAYILPAGISLEKKKLMEGPKGCTELSKQTVMVVSANQEFVNAWTSILRQAHCHVATRFPARATKNDPGVDIVVSDNTCPASVVRRCLQLDVALVSSEWVAQCLINGHLVDVGGHERYKHDFSEKS